MANSCGPGDGSPYQDPKERRNIRRQFRDLLHQTKERKEELLSREHGPAMLNNMLNRTNNIFSNVKMPREAALDSQIIATLAQMGKQQVQALQTEFVTFQPVEYTEKLLGHFGVQRMNEGGETEAVTGEMWEELGKNVSPCFRKAPVLNFLFGAFDRGPPKEKVRVERRQKVKDQVAKTAVVPKQIRDINDQEKREATTEEVEHILAFLNLYYEKWDKQPICYFEFVVDPMSFGRTVENIFYTSFLVRDGHVRIFLDDDKLPVIEPVQPNENGPSGSDSAERSQVVQSITKSEWEEIVRIFKIQSALIPLKKKA